MSRAEIVGRLRAAGCVFAEDEAAVLLETADTPEQLRALVERRAAGLPLEHVVGWVELDGLRLSIDPGVFVPRRRSELLVREAAARATPGSVVVDLACGCGAVGAAVAARLGAVELWAVDVDAAAVRCAARNLARFGGHAVTGDLYAALPATLGGRVDVVVANLPHVPTAAVELMPREARLHEPRRALDGGADGLDLFRRVAADAPAWLAPGGHVVAEVGADQAEAAADALGRAGLVPAVARDEDLAATVVVGTAKPGPGPVPEAGPRPDS